MIYLEGNNYDTQKQGSYCTWILIILNALLEAIVVPIFGGIVFFLLLHMEAGNGTTKILIIEYRLNLQQQK